MNNLGPKLAGIAVIAASNAIGTMITFGSYGYYKDKGYGNWKAGAAAGATIGAVAGVMLLAMTGLGVRAGDVLVPATPEMAGCAGCGISGLQIQEMPGAIGLLAAQSLSGLTMQQVAGLTVTQL